MRRSRDRSALNERHQKVSGLVWGLMFIALGGLLTLQQVGRLDLLGARPEGERLTEHAAERIVDTDPETRWSSRFDDDQWIHVDLGSSVPIGRVRLHWEEAYARVYEIQLSDDGEAWRTAVRVDDGSGGTRELPVGESARYVKVAGIERGTDYGFSLWEVEVFGPPEGDGDAGGALLSAGRPVTASSRERVLFEEAGPFPFLIGFWFRWWPLFVIAAGLPHLLVPRSDGEELGGLVTVAVGLLFLLDNLDWTWREAAPIVLVLAGFTVLTQAFRQGRHGSSTGDADSSRREG